MSSDRQRRRAAARAQSTRDAKVSPPAVPPASPPVPRADWWLVLAFLLPSLSTLVGSFLYDDVPLIVQNARLHSLARLPEIWTHGYWPDRPGLTLYRPVTQTVWSLLWTIGGGGPWPFHALNLILGAAVVVLFHRLLLNLRIEPRPAFVAALLFAVLPIHAEVTAAIVGSNELLAAVFGFGALLLHRHGGHTAALLLFALAVFSKESAAAIAGLALLLPWLAPGPRPVLRHFVLTAGCSLAVVALALWLRARVAEGPVFIPPIDNPMSLVSGPQRILTALWVQVLYLERTIFPLTLAADYSYKQIPLVMSLGDPRAWAGLVLVVAALGMFIRFPATRVGLVLWIVLFAPAANVLMPIGTVMGERLAYLPSAGLALLAAQAFRRLPHWHYLVAAVVVVFAARTFHRNLDWRDADAFYPKLAETSPASAKAQYFLGCYRAARDDYPAALAAYDRAIQIFPAYPEALNNRGGALVALGRLEEAKASYRQCLRFDPNHAGAAASLRALEAGIRFVPQKPIL